MTEIQNKFPGKDVTPEDLATKFPLVAKRDPDHFSRFTVAGVEFGGKEVPIMAGPNMVESKELIVDIAKNVKQRGAHFLRGGAFKPLTFPYRSAKYNETREQGIEWLGEAKKIAGIPVITEVMEEKSPTSSRLVRATCRTIRSSPRVHALASRSC
jgi:3-deoxy-7-phosphoheptulonate synthase